MILTELVTPFVHDSHESSGTLRRKLLVKALPAAPGHIFVAAVAFYKSTWFCIALRSTRRRKNYLVGPWLDDRPARFGY